MFHVTHGLQCHKHDDQVRNTRAPWWVQLLSVQLLSVMPEMLVAGEFAWQHVSSHALLFQTER